VRKSVSGHPGTSQDTGITRAHEILAGAMLTIDPAPPAATPRPSHARDRAVPLLGGPDPGVSDDDGAIPGNGARPARSGVSMSMMRPCSMIATRSQSRSASSIRCVVRKTGLAARADAADEIPDGAARLRIESGRQLVQEDELGSLTSASAMKSRCFWPPESVMNQASRFSARPS
jgi:hypothetical protein